MNKKKTQLRDENAHNDKSVHGVLTRTYQAGLRRDAVQPDIEAERKKRDEIEAGKSYCSRRFGGATCDDKSAQIYARFDRDVFFSSRRRHTSLVSDWSSDVCSSDLSIFLKCWSVIAMPAPIAGKYNRSNQVSFGRGTVIAISTPAPACNHNHARSFSMTTSSKFGDRHDALAGKRRIGNTNTIRIGRSLSVEKSNNFGGQKNVHE